MKRIKLLISAGMTIGLLSISILAFEQRCVGDISAQGTRETVKPEETVGSPKEKAISPQAISIINDTTPQPTQTPGIKDKSEETPEPIHEPCIEINEKDKELLIRIAMAEAEDQDTEGKALVMQVVINRVHSNEFPDSIEEVIFQKNQFSPVSNGRFDRVKPDQDCRKALELVQKGCDESQGALYFESESASTWHRRHLKYLFKHGDHMFYGDKEA